MLDPRIELVNLGLMICFHKKYNLGDEHSIDHNDFTSWNHMGRHLSRQFNTAVILPLYLCDHSGITISTNPFFDRWDSGQIGFILAPRRDVAKWFGAVYCTNRLVKAAKDQLLLEVEAYDNYLTGEEEDE